MKRLFVLSALVLPLALLQTASLDADVKAREKTAIKFEGMLGRMMGLFGGKAARDGIVSTEIVKGDRKVTLTENSGEIIDLAEEKIYTLDLKKKTYAVKTFEEIREEMRKAREEAEREAEKQAEREPEEAAEPGKEYEVDFDVKETGEKKSMAGYDTRQVIMTITLREKGKALEEAGGFVMTADSWMGPKVAALQEIVDFDIRYWKQLQGPEVAAMSAQQMATLLAAFPMVQTAMDRMKQEGSKLEGTVIAQTTTFESVKSKEALAKQQESSGGGGFGGMLARRMKKGDAKPRSVVFTTMSEVQEVGTAVTAEDVAIPAGFKEKK